MLGGVVGATVVRALGPANPPTAQIDVQTSKAVADLLIDVGKLQQRVRSISTMLKLPPLD